MVSGSLVLHSYIFVFYGLGRAAKPERSALRPGWLCLRPGWLGLWSSFVLAFIRSFVHSFFRSFVHSFFRSMLFYLQNATLHEAMSVALWVRRTDRPSRVSQVSQINSNKFLDASTHLYMRVCPSVRRSVRRSRVSQISQKWRPEDNRTLGNP